MKRKLAVLAALVTVVIIMIPVLAKKPAREPEPETFTVSNMVGDITMEPDSLTFTAVAYEDWESDRKGWFTFVHKDDYEEGTIPVTFTITLIDGDPIEVVGYVYTLQKSIQRIKRDTYVKWHIAFRDMTGELYRICQQIDEDNSYDPILDTWHVEIENTCVLDGEYDRLGEIVLVSFDVHRGV